jgi:hypothetical protein
MLRRIIMTFLVTAIALSVVMPVSAIAKIKIYVDETRTEYVEADKLDCRTYEGKRGLTIGFKAGFYTFNFGPQLTLGGDESIKWDKSVHGLIAQYKELCTRFNAGAVTLKEYKERIEKLDSLATEMLEFQDKLMQRVKSESRDAFRELEMETRGSSELSPDEVIRQLNSIDSRLENLQ